MIDISRARLVHIKWLLQLESALREGKIPVLESHMNCELGHWLYEEGIKKYQQYPEMKFLESGHKRFHETTALLIKLFIERNYVEAEMAMDELKRESQDLIFMMTMVEYRLLGGPEKL